MTYFKWKDSFNIGIDEIDQQHRSFLEHLNDCYLQAFSGKRSEFDPSMIDGLKTYADTHFRFEESLMRAKGYPKVGDHERQHKYFESQIVEFENAYAGGTGKITESVFVFLRDWFLEHILDEDKGFISYVK